MVLYPKRTGIRINAKNTCYLNLYNRKVKIKFMIIGLIVFITPIMIIIQSILPIVMIHIKP